MTKKERCKYNRAHYQKNKKKVAKQGVEYRRKNKRNIAKRMVAYRRKNKKKITKQIVEWRRKNKKKVTKQLAVYAFKAVRTMAGRHRSMLDRHKRQLAPRGIKGRPMSIEAHRKKLYYADGRERLCWYCHRENNKAGSGLDRLDNNKTYTVANTVPCCRGCNSWRGSTHSVQETRDSFKPMRDAQRKG
jgi:hypothetical protein